MAPRKLTAVPEAPPAPRLRDSVDAALAEMKWLTPSDQALADLARTIADQIDAAQVRADLLEEAYRDAGGDPGMFKRLQRLEAMCDVAKAVAANAQPLLLALRDLGGTPAARKVMDGAAKSGGKLAGLRTAATPPKSGSSSSRAAPARKRAAAAVDAAAEATDAPVVGRVRGNRVR